MASLDNEKNLLDLASEDTTLNRKAATHGGEWAGPCPFCGGHDRFLVWPFRGEYGGWWCRQCGRGGDRIAYLVETGRITPRQAGRMRHGEQVADLPVRRLRREPERTSKSIAVPPNDQWQARGKAFTALAEAALWSATGLQALTWLRQRGLRDETVRGARLGYNERDRWEAGILWGLEADMVSGSRKPRQVWLPRGIVMPWFFNGSLWRLNVRRPVKPGEEPKCIGPAGFSNGLYGADALMPGKAAVIVEGELDALTILQEAGDLVVPVATGGVSGSRRARWIASLALCPVVLVAFDADTPGESARRYWLQHLDNGVYWRPPWGDANQLMQDGASVRGWVCAGLGRGIKA